MTIHENLSGDEVVENVLRPSHALTITRVEDWKLAAFRRFRPLVFFVAFGADVQFRMLRLSLSSLHEFGLYDGDILIMTDRGDLSSFVPDALAPRTAIWVEKNVGDVLDYTCSRYCIAEWPGIENYNPVLYVDTDVVFDAPIINVLKPISLGDKIFAEGNPESLMTSGPGVGLDHYEEASINIMGKTGINTGILGIPLPATKSGLLSLVRDSIYRYAAAMGTRQIGWYDQPTVNYVLNVLGQVDGDLLHHAVRWGGRSALHGGLSPRGFIHLWGGEKESEMEDVLAMMRGKPRPSDADWVVYDFHEPWSRHEVNYLSFDRQEVTSTGFGST